MCIQWCNDVKCFKSNWKVTSVAQLSRALAFDQLSLNAAFQVLLEKAKVCSQKDYGFPFWPWVSPRYRYCLVWYQWDIFVRSEKHRAKKKLKYKMLNIYSQKKPDNVALTQTYGEKSSKEISKCPCIWTYMYKIDR